MRNIEKSSVLEDYKPWMSKENPKFQGARGSYKKGKKKVSKSPKKGKKKEKTTLEELANMKKPKYHKELGMK